MELLNYSARGHCLNAICQDVLGENVHLLKYIHLLHKNPDWLEENSEGFVDGNILLQLIHKSYVNKMYLEFLRGLIDVIRAQDISDEIFEKLFNYPDIESANMFKISLSHKSLTEKQLLMLCQSGAAFECYFELAILYYIKDEFAFGKFIEFINTFKCGKFSYMYKELILELANDCQASSLEKELWVAEQLVILKST